jgi:hypothetical protein
MKEDEFIKKAKKKILALDKHPYLTGVIEILEDSDCGGFYVKVLSDYPDLFLHVSKKGIVKTVDSDRNLLVKNNTAALLLSAIVLEVK